MSEELSEEKPVADAIDNGEVDTGNATAISVAVTSQQVVTFPVAIVNGDSTSSPSQVKIEKAESSATGTDKADHDNSLVVIKMDDPIGSKDDASTKIPVKLELKTIEVKKEVTITSSGRDDKSAITSQVSTIYPQQQQQQQQAPNIVVVSSSMSYKINFLAPLINLARPLGLTCFVRKTFPKNESRLFLTHSFQKIG